MKPQLSLKVVTRFVAAFIAATALPLTAEAQVLEGTVSGSSYTTGSWISGATSNLGNWFMNVPTGGLTQIGNSSTGNRTNIGAESFYINSSLTDPAAYVDVYLSLGGQLSAGQSFSVSASYLWNGGMRGIEFAKAFGGTLGRFEYGGGIDPLRFISGNVTTQVYSNAYQQAFTYSLTYVNPTTVNVSATLFGSTGKLLDSNVTVVDMPDQIKFYITGVTDPANYDNYGLYFNNIVSVPEPSTWALIILGSAFILWRVRTRRLS